MFNPFVTKHAAVDYAPDVVSFSEDRKKELRKKEKAIIATLIGHSPYRLGQFRDSAGDGYIIEQRYYRKWNGLESQRFIVHENNRHIALTVANLKMPEIITTHHLNPENWRVDHSRLFASYNLMQIAAGFALDGLSFNRNEESHQLQRVLQIGLGGGTATSYLAAMPIDLHIDVIELEPDVYDTAMKWFELPSSPNVNVHIMDGVVFLLEAAANGLFYDSVILDASTNAPNASIICPHEVFLQDEVIEAMSTVIGTRGVLSVNLCMPNDRGRLHEEVVGRFAAHFRSCFSLVVSLGGEKILLCTNRPDFDWKRQKKRILSNLDIFDMFMETAIAPYIDLFNTHNTKSSMTSDPSCMIS